MGDALEEIEAAVVEVTKARQSLVRKRTRQVTTAQEIDRLKSVAFAWFKNHRPTVAEHHTRADLTDVDDAYRVVMESTGRRAARTTYADALRNARNSLLEIRTIVATTPNMITVAITSDTPPNFAPLAADPAMQLILGRRWDEVQHCVAAQAYLAATVMMGGLLETLLLARINSSPQRPAVFTAATAPRDRSGRTLSLGDWKLVKMVEVAHELNWITKSAMDIGNVLRDFRNYIHPHKEHTDGIVIIEDDARMFWEVTKAITRQVLTSVGRSP